LIVANASNDHLQYKISGIIDVALSKVALLIFYEVLIILPGPFATSEMNIALLPVKTDGNSP
jgi:hypothetical protein